jgi:apoptosis-inducing factor 2
LLRVVPASEYLAGELAAARRPDGFVEVTPELLVAGQDRVFALGDVSAADQNKGAGAAGRQAPIVVSNIRALITRDGELARYQPPPAGIIVPIGPDGGGGQRPDSADLVPAEVVAQLKGRDVMVQRFAELLGGERDCSELSFWWPTRPSPGTSLIAIPPKPGAAGSEAMRTYHDPRVRRPP